MRLHIFICLVTILLPFVQTQDVGVVSTACEGSSCLECVENGCGWVGASGFCLVSCDYIADAPCYSSETIPEASNATDVCSVLERETNDVELCRTASDCYACLDTFKSDGVTPCQWYSVTQSCGTGACNILGCGSSDCDVGELANRTVTAGLRLSPMNGTLSDLSSWQDATVQHLQTQAQSDDTKMTLSEVEISDVVQEVKILEQRRNLQQDLALEIQFTIAMTYLNEDGSKPQDLGDFVANAFATDTDRSAYLAQLVASDPTTFENIQTVQLMTDKEEEVGGGSVLSCSTALTCNECLVLNCAWSQNVCENTCGDDTSALSSCYSTEVFPESTPDIICLREMQDTEDREICTATNCGDCVATLRADGLNTCLWDDVTLSCGFGENNEIGSAAASICNDVENSVTTCSIDYTSCRACLEAGCAWSSDSCLNSCESVSNTTCYDMLEINTDMVNQLCTIADTISADREICNQIVDCTECAQTMKSDGSSACRWKSSNSDGIDGLCTSDEDDESSAMSACTDKRDNEIVVLSCSDAISCEDCLDFSCFWNGNQCLTSCDKADSSCLNVKSLSNLTTQQMCEEERSSLADVFLCRQSTDCETCVSTTKSSSVGRCMWYADGINSWCGTGACNKGGQCGSYQCERVENSAISTSSCRTMSFWVNLVNLSVVVATFIASIICY